MARKRRFSRAGFNQKLIVDVGLAGLAVRVLPQLINKVFPLSPTLYSVAAAGGTYVLGSMLKKPDMANAGIALGLVEIIAPMVEGITGGIGGSEMISTTSTGKVTVSPSGLPQYPVNKFSKVKQVLSDFYPMRLNDYVGMPGTQNYPAYAGSY